MLTYGESLANPIIQVILLIKVVLLVLEMLVYIIGLGVQDFLLTGATVSWIASTACSTTYWLIGDISYHGSVTKLLMLVISVLHSVSAC